MKTSYFYLLILSILLTNCGKPGATTQVASMIDADDETELRNLKTVLWPKAYGEQDTVLLDQILHKDFELVDDNGDTYSKTDELEYISNYGPSYNEFEFQVERVSLFDNGTAMVSGKGIMKGENSSGEAYITTYKSSNTLIKVGGQWKAINSHVSGVKEEVFQNSPN